MNSIFDSNTATEDGGAVQINNSSATPRIYNNTFIDNQAINGAGEALYINDCNSGAKIINNIFATNNANSNDGISNNSQTFIFEYNLYDEEQADVGSPGSGTDNIYNQPPEFENYPVSLNLTQDSPCVDSGKNLTSEGVTGDYEETSRPQSFGFDMGAYESGYEMDSIIFYLPTPSDLTSAIPKGKTWTHLKDLVESKTTGTILISPNADIDPNTATITYNGTSIIWPSTSNLTLRGISPTSSVIEATENSGVIFNLDNSQTSAISVTFDRIKVQNAHGEFNGVVFTTPGTEYVQNFTATGCYFINNFAEGNYNGPIFYHTSLTTNIVNCLFQGNKGRTGGVIYDLRANSFVRNCRFINNSSTIYHGGAINISFGEISGCWFEDNTSVRFGGAIFDPRSGVIKNNIFVSNNAGWDGGAIYMNNAVAIPEIYNNTFINNTASGGIGGAIVIAGCADNLRVHNNIFNNNSAANGDSGIWDENNETYYLYNNIYDGPASDIGSNAVSNNFYNNTTPTFVDYSNNNFRLVPTSNGVDQGIDLSPTVDVDYDGNVRPDPTSNIFDIGAYETYDSVQ